MIKHGTLIIGGGASGMVAAIIAKEYGQDVAIIEGGDRVGRKLLTTGNGQCNITNRQCEETYDRHHSFNGQFHHAVFDQFSYEETIGLLYRLGIPTIELTKGRVYPKNLQASSVIDLLRMNLEERNIPVYLNEKIMKIAYKQDGFHLRSSETTFFCDALIVATGGISAPRTGSDGSIHRALEGLGHRLTPLLPSIVQLVLEHERLPALAGVKVDALAKVVVDGVVVREDFDEVLFTKYGISGPAILQISREASLALHQKRRVEIELDMFSEKTEEELIDYFEAHFSLFPQRSIHDALNGILNKKLIPVVLKEVGIENIHLGCDQISYQQKRALYSHLKAWRFKVTDTNGFASAQATIGGINTEDVHPETLESKLIENLYFCGEVLDVDGDCGGFNLQWAWSSAVVCAKAMALKRREDKR